jgi:hypothetical protein
MHGFHHSRVRILFEVLCAFAISASCIGAWIQTDAWALLPAAFVAALYGLIHALDMAGRRSTAWADPQKIDFATDQRDDLLVDQDACMQLAATDQQLTIEYAIEEAAAEQQLSTENVIEEAAAEQRLATENAIEEADPVKPTVPRASGGRRAKASRKSGGRRASVPKVAEVTELARHVEAEIAAPMTAEDAASIPLAPLFEPEPFVRQQRAVFGRKAG